MAFGDYLLHYECEAWVGWLVQHVAGVDGGQSEQVDVGLEGKKELLAAHNLYVDVVCW